MAGESLLLVDGGVPERASLERQLAGDGFAVIAADRGAAALELLERSEPDLVLLDVSLPDASGYELCRTLREGEPGRCWNREVPVILVSERGDPLDRVRGFARGADDYVMRPYVYEELVARIRAVLRRSRTPVRPDRLVVDELEIDRLARVVRVAGVPVLLAAKEFELLLALAADPERVRTKEELLRDVWGYRSTARTRTLDSHASRLRRKLDPDGRRGWVCNVWGVGYRLVGPGPLRAA